MAFSIENRNDPTRWDSPEKYIGYYFYTYATDHETGLDEKGVYPAKNCTDLYQERYGNNKQFMA